MMSVLDDWVETINYTLLTSRDGDQCDAFISLIPPELRPALAAKVYQTNKEVTLGRAAEIAGVFGWEIANVLRAYGVEPEYCQATREEVEKEIAKLEGRNLR